MTHRILLADDHALMRAGLGKLVASFAGCEVVAEAADGREALALAKRHAPDIVLLDITMPELNGLDACRRLAEELPACRVILLSMHSSEDFVLRGVQAGARGYVLKDAAPEELELAIRAVAAGGTFYSPKVTGHLVEQLRRGEAQPRGDELSVRQREVLQLIAEGRSTREIAERLHLSVKTIETHRAQVMAKLDIRDVASLTRYAIRIGLIDPGD
ncbi:MAG: response regulator transcription factor [Betaproteobacteria bacterium]|nr:response regulator transcription factor [Betaproteobacteria bacterium]